MKNDWVDNCLLALLVAFVVAVGVCIYMAVTDHSKDDFMRECEQHEPHYRCVAMWRAGESQSVPVMMPMPMPAIH